MCAYDVPEPAFMILELQTDAATNLHGVAHYQDAFNES